MNLYLDIIFNHPIKWQSHTSAWNELWDWNELVERGAISLDQKESENGNWISNWKMWDVVCSFSSLHPSHPTLTNRLRQKDPKTCWGHKVEYCIRESLGHEWSLASFFPTVYLMAKDRQIFIILRRKVMKI